MTLSPLVGPEFITIKEVAFRLKASIDHVYWIIENELLCSYVPTNSFECRYNICSNDECTLHDYSKVSDTLKWYGVNNGSSGSILGFNKVEILNDAGETVYVIQGTDIRDSCSYESVRISSKELAEFQALSGKQNRKKETHQQVSMQDNPKSIVSLLKMIIIMAKKHYKYDPTAERSTVPAMIVRDAALMNIIITEKTVRDWLQKAANHPMVKNVR